MLLLHAAPPAKFSCSMLQQSLSHSPALLWFALFHRSSAANCCSHAGMTGSSFASFPATSTSSAGSLHYGHHGHSTAPVGCSDYGFQSSTSGRAPTLGLKIQIPHDITTDATAIEGEAARNHQAQQMHITTFMQNGPAMTAAEPAFLPRAPPCPCPW